MRARTRLAWISLFCALLFVAAALLPSSAQVHGVPPSVTSFGFGGSNNPTPGIPASVTSVGPFGWGGDCCFGPFGPFGSPFVSPRHSAQFDGHRGHHNHDWSAGRAGVWMPFYVPFPVPYGVTDITDDENADVDVTDSRGVPPVYHRGPWDPDAAAARPTSSEASVARKQAAPAPVASEPPATVAPQPATVLVYKDGHKAEVENYAIVGDTLFDFADNRYHKILLADLDLPATEKANDERGIDFQVPAERPHSK